MSCIVATLKQENDVSSNWELHIIKKDPGTCMGPCKSGLSVVEENERTMALVQARHYFCSLHY